jgi:hypothetical protein
MKQDSDGYRKIYGACQLAKRLGFEWIWIDTCCIDKTSSAELTEAINWMFNYYSKARLCIAHLSDVLSSKATGVTNHHRSSKFITSFRNSAWFTRGWTLQELLAPARLEFYDRYFQHIGSKASMSEYISATTGIATKYLKGQTKFNEASIATRMSWASNRETTRLEDQAYSLLGIFGVNMPLLYGEGEMAFFRLQREILGSSDDESIFGWSSEDAPDDEPLGMLAISPRNFRYSRDMQPIDLSARHRPMCAFTSRGVEIWHGLKGAPPPKSTPQSLQRKVAIACKQCPGYDKRKWRIIAIWLRKIKGRWYRVFCSRFYYASHPLYSGHFETFYVAQPNLKTTPQFSDRDRRKLSANARLQAVRQQRTIERRERTKMWQKGILNLAIGGLAASPVVATLLAEFLDNRANRL